MESDKPQVSYSASFSVSLDTPAEPVKDSAPEPRPAPAAPKAAPAMQDGGIQPLFSMSSAPLASAPPAPQARAAQPSVSGAPPLEAAPRAAPTAERPDPPAPRIPTSTGASEPSPGLPESKPEEPRPAQPDQPQARPAPHLTAVPSPQPTRPPAQEHAAAAPLLRINSLSKQFGQVRACQEISLDVAPGEIHALLGENGAGKSTLVKIIGGRLRADSGTISFDGRPCRFATPNDARRAGIGMVAQHFSTFDGLSVAENLAVALPERSLGALKRDIRKLGESYGLPLDPNRRVASLSAGEKQRVEIIRCLLQDPRLLILDEPTSVLTPQEAEALFSTLHRLTGEGRSVLYITHRLEEVRAHCNRATVLRHGQMVGQVDPREVSAAQLAEMMIGAAPVRPERRLAYVGAARLEVKDLDLPSKTGVSLKALNLSARKGEILGIAGVAGEGQSELFAALSGETPVRRHDAILLDGAPIGCFGPSRRRKLEAAFVPEERFGHAALADYRLSDNLRLSLSGFGTSNAERREKVAEIVEKFDIRAEGSDPFAGTLSGGNLQKFTIGREILRQPKLLVANQPTWGVDAGAAATIHAALLELRESAAAIVIISQDLDEIFALCDRVAVLSRGTLSKAQPVADVTPESLGLLMAGATPEEVTAQAAQPEAVDA